MVSEALLHNPLFQILLSLALGGLIGLRREMEAFYFPKSRGPVGLRTSMLFCLLGTISTFFAELPYLPVIIFSGLVLLVVAAYVHGLTYTHRLKMTTELIALCLFWVGVLLGKGELVTAILIAIFLSAAKEFHNEILQFIRRLTVPELRGMLQLLVVSGAILPFLPQTPIDPWGIFVPFKIWLLVIFISGINFVGYFLSKYFGERGGIPLTGILGALVSSTAVTVSFSTQSKKQTNITRILAVGMLLALGVMEWRVLLEIYLIGSSDMKGLFLLVPGLMGLFTLGYAWFVWKAFVRKEEKSLEAKNTEFKIKSPFHLLPALKFGGIFVAVLFAIAAGKHFLGDMGVYAAAFLSGLVDIDAVVLSSLESVRLGELSVDVAQKAIFVGLMVNTLIKIVYIVILGSRKLLRQTGVGIILTALVGVGIFFLI
ncbi:MgtC/SapB family protein [Candidatus Gracilibacteria bacterium]|nr:MgtC/SapB family protein [Candidatus Gracilibacteria bacterium]